MQNKVLSTVERYTGENIPRQYFSKEEAEDAIKKSAEAIVTSPIDPTSYVTKAIIEYKLSRGIRGDNTPESTTYFGYLDARSFTRILSPSPRRTLCVNWSGE